MGKNGKAVICVSTREASLKKRLRRHLKSLGFHKTDDGTFASPGASKEVIRTIHSAQRDDRLALNRDSSLRVSQASSNTSRQARP